MVRRGASAPVAPRVGGGADAPPRPLPIQPGQHHWGVDELFVSGAAVQVLHHRAYAIGMHTHGFIEVNLIAAGRGWHHLEDHAFPVQRGDAFVIPEGARHGYEGRADLDVEHLILHPRFLVEHLARLQEVPGFLPLFTVEPFFRAEEGTRHRLRLDRAATEAVIGLLAAIPSRGDAPADQLAAEGLGLAAIAHLCRAWSAEHPEAGSTSPRMDAVLAMIDTIERRHAEPLRLAEIAAAAAMTASSCCRLFRAVTGTSPMEHLRQVRIRRAGALLRSGLPLADVAARTGFCDGAHLVRTFRRLTGRTPGAWRRGTPPATGSKSTNR